MRTREILLLLAAVTWMRTAVACAQDSQSLGDAARQARLQKQQKAAKAKDAPTPPKDAQPAPPKKVVTNDDIPEHVGSTLTSPSRTASPLPAYPPQSYGPRQAPAEQWKFMIQAQKKALVSLQCQIDDLSEFLQHPETCIADCTQRNERQKEKEVQLESMKTQRDQHQKMLEELQEAARKQGFGSAVYDP
jgi:hypothetical protein